MKKALIFVLAIAIVFIFASCSKGSSSAPAASAPATTTSTAAAAPAATTTTPSTGTVDTEYDPNKTVDFQQQTSEEEWQKYIKDQQVRNRLKEYMAESRSMRFADTYWFYFDVFNLENN